MITRAQYWNGRQAAAGIAAALATLCVLALLASACEQPGPVATTPIVLPAATLQVSPAAPRMVVGSQQEFTAIRSDGRESRTLRMSEVSWSIDDETVGSLAVRPDGVAVVTGRAPGWLMITAWTGEISGSTDVQVVAP